MPILLALLLLAPDADPETAPDRVAEVVQLLGARENAKAVELLKEIAGHKKNHVEAKSLVKLVRNTRLEKPPEVLDAVFGALEGIGSRKVTGPRLALLDHSTLKKDPAVRAGVYRALGGSTDPSRNAVKELIGGMRDREDQVVAAAAAAAGNYRYAKESLRKDLFKTILDIYESTWNLKNSVDPERKVEKARAEKKWEIVEKPMEKSLQLLSNVTMNDPPEWRRWWNKNKSAKWQELDN